MAKKKKQKPDPFEVITRFLREYGKQKIVVWSSCGKDSIANLDLCVRHFGAENVQPIFMYFVKGLSFQETYLQYIENKYNVEFARFPHWMLAGMFRTASFRHGTEKSVNTPQINMKKMDDAARKRFGVEWIASGETECESIQRVAMIRECNAINDTRRRFWPIAKWGPTDVMSWLKAQGTLLAPDYKFLGRSFGSIRWKEVEPIREHYPDDYEKICDVFPMLRAQAVRHDQRKSKDGST